MKHENPYAAAPCANSDDLDAWFVNKGGKLDPEDAREIRERHTAHLRSDDFMGRAVCDEAADQEIADLERANRRRLRGAIRACYFDCPMALRLKCLADGLEEPYGVRGAYTEAERRQIVKIRDEHELSGARVVDIAISTDRREALTEEESHAN